MERDEELPANPFLAANMQRLMKARGITSIEALRHAMSQAQPPIAIGQGTLHRAIKGDAGNRLSSLKKIAGFFDISVDQLLQPEGGVGPIWPFSLELQEAVLNMEPDDLYFMEVAMWSHLRQHMPEDRHFQHSDKRSEEAPRKPPIVSLTRTPSRVSRKQSS